MRAFIARDLCCDVAEAEPEAEPGEHVEIEQQPGLRPTPITNGPTTVGKGGPDAASYLLTPQI